MRTKRARRPRKSGIASPLAARAMKPRQSRHGRPLADVYIKRTRTVETNPKTGVLEVKIVTRPMTPDEINAERARVLRATSPTTTYGNRNTSTTSKKKD